jgi:hypothetical protein
LYAATAIEQNEKDAAVRADLLTSLGIFGRLAYPMLDALSLIGREKMKESKAYQEILKEGREEGAIRAHRDDVLDVVTSRFGQRSAGSVKTALQSIGDVKRLKAILKLAVRCSELEELVKAIAD